MSANSIESLPLLSAGDKRPEKLGVFSIEECQSCKLKTKRGFRAGDYVHKKEGQCQSCKGNLMIIMVYGEPIKAS